MGSEIIIFGGLVLFLTLIICYLSYTIYYKGSSSATVTTLQGKDAIAAAIGTVDVPACPNLQNDYATILTNMGVVAVPFGTSCPSGLATTATAGGNTIGDNANHNGYSLCIPPSMATSGSMSLGSGSQSSLLNCNPDNFMDSIVIMGWLANTGLSGHAPKTSGSSGACSIQ
jgi:hypothetical protein